MIGVAAAVAVATAACGGGGHPEPSGFTSSVPSPSSGTAASTAVVAEPATKSPATSEATLIAPVTTTATATRPALPTVPPEAIPKLLQVGDIGCSTSAGEFQVTLVLTFQGGAWEGPKNAWTPIFDAARNHVWSPRIEVDGPAVVLIWKRRVGTGTGSPSPGISSFGGDFVLTLQPPGATPVDVPFWAHVNCAT